jgi:DNA-binding transcriptional LysR family regulator
MFDGQLLRTFLTVSECGGFTRAAEQLNMSQSAVSLHIRRLEEQVGVPLLRRTTRKVALTAEGETLVGYARTITSLQEEAHSRLSPRSRLKGKLRIGTSEDFAASALPIALRSFNLRNPGVALEVQVGITTDLVNLLDRGRLDLVLGKQCDRLHSDRGELLWHEELVWAYSAHTRLDVDRPIPLAFFPEPCAYRDAALKALSKSRSRWRIAFVSPSIAGVRAAAISGFAATPLTRSMIDSQLRIISAREGLPQLPQVRFVMFRGREDGQANKMIQLLASAIKEQANSSRFIQPGSMLSVMSS